MFLGGKVYICECKKEVNYAAGYENKFNPDQFEIIKFRKGNDEKDLSINGKCPYFRILIKNKRVLNMSQCESQQEFGIGQHY